MDKKEILKLVDFTLLKQTSTFAEIMELIDNAAATGVAAVCVPQAFVEKSVAYSAGRVPVCTVVGFPNGNSTTASKVFETAEAITLGAAEIDMVINIGWLKEGNYDLILNEINAIKQACGGHVLKVIIETCLLTDDEKIKMCEIVSNSTADYIKTSTGFSTAGATVADVALFKKHVSPRVKVKAAGGISTFEDAEKLVEAGAVRLGTSKLVKIYLENK